MEDDCEESQGAVRPRGPTTLRFLDNLRPGQRLEVQSWLKAPIGPNSTYMSTYVSHLAKDGNNFPLTISNWHRMPAVSVLKAILDIKKVFDYPDDLNDWIRTRLRNRWKGHKHSMKKEGFYKYKTQEERLAHRPKGVVESQWGPLIEYWQNPRQDAISAMTKAAKAKQTVYQTTGSKPHVKYAAELEAKLKRPPTAQEIYDATHAKQKEKCAKSKASKSKQTVQQSTGSKLHVKHAAELEAKLKRTPTAQEIHDAVHAKRKKQMEGLENKPSQHSSESSESSGEEYITPVSSSKKRKMNAVSRSKPKRQPCSRSNSISTSPVPLIQECVTEDNEDNMQAQSDESLGGSGSFWEPEDDDDNMQAESDESLEDFGSVGEPIEPARTTSSAELVEAAKITSSAKSLTGDSNLVSISSPKDVWAPLFESFNVSGRGSDVEFEFVDNFKVPKEYAVLYKRIFDKYGHIATRVNKSNGTILVACVTSLLKIVSAMETVRGADLSEDLLESWEGDIEDCENLGFNIAWLREKFNEVKDNWNSSSGIRNEVEIHEKELDATQVKYAGLLTRKAELQRETSEVIIEIRKAEAKISFEEKSIQVKLAPKKNFLNEPVLGKVLS